MYIGTEIIEKTLIDIWEPELKSVYIILFLCNKFLAQIWTVIDFIKLIH